MLAVGGGGEAVWGGVGDAGTVDQHRQTHSYKVMHTAQHKLHTYKHHTLYKNRVSMFTSPTGRKEKKLVDRSPKQARENRPSRLCKKRKERTASLTLHNIHSTRINIIHYTYNSLSNDNFSDGRGGGGETRRRWLKTDEGGSS